MMPFKRDGAFGMETYDFSLDEKGGKDEGIVCNK